MRTPFKPSMVNIPIWNLRDEFRLTQALLSSSEFELQLRLGTSPVRTPLFDWHGETNDLPSVLVQRAIQGLESYTTGAVWSKLVQIGRMTAALNAAIRDPFSLKRGAGTAAVYYEHLPALIDKRLSLSQVDPEFWIELKNFYRSVRNPLFHGYHFQQDDLPDAIESFRIVNEVYLWLDQWYDSGWKDRRRILISGTFSAD